MLPSKWVDRIRSEPRRAGEVAADKVAQDTVASRLRRDIDRPGSVVAAVLAEVAALLVRTFAGLNGSVCRAFFRGIYNTHSHKRIHGLNIRINRPVMPQISWHI